MAPMITTSVLEVGWVGCNGESCTQISQPNTVIKCPYTILFWAAVDNSSMLWG